MFSRIRQDGGGKMSKKDKDIYLGHCDVILNTKKQPLTVEQIIESADYLLKKLDEIVTDELNTKITEVSDVQDKLPEEQLNYSSLNILKEGVDTILDAVFDRTLTEISKQKNVYKEIIQIKEPEELRNKLRIFINIISFQFLVEFSYYLLGYREPSKSDFVNLNDEYKIFREFIQKTSNSWRIFSSDMENTRLIQSLSYNNGLVVALTHFGVDNTIQFLLKNQCICGMSFEHEPTDGRMMLPVEFVMHDITHYNNFKFLFDDCDSSSDVVTQLYEHIKKQPDSIRYPAKLILYLTLHEPVYRGQCYDGIKTLSEYVHKYVSDLANIDMFGLLIPKVIRDGNMEKLSNNPNDEINKKIIKHDIVTEYTKYCFECYKYAFDTFKDPTKENTVPEIPDMLKPYIQKNGQTAGRRKTHRKLTTKRRKQPRSRRRRHRK
jgi:hypothetical protein